MTAVVQKKITRDDIESKFREVQGEVDEASTGAKSYVLAAGIGAVVLTILIAFLLGRRRGKSQRTVVEIRRV